MTETVADPEAIEDAKVIAYLNYHSEIPGLADLAWAAYRSLRTRMGVAWIDPVIGSNGECFGFYWDRGDHHASVDMGHDEPGFCFYRNRSTEQFWGEDYAADAGPDAVPEAFVRTLKLIFELAR